MKDGRVNGLSEYTEKLPCAGIMFSELYAHLISSSPLFEEGTITIPTSQRRKWTLREVNSLAQGYTGYTGGRAGFW